MRNQRSGTSMEGPICAPVAITTSAPLPASAEISFAVAASGEAPGGIRLFNDTGDEVIVGVGGSPLEVFVDRRRSRLTPFHEAYPGRHAGPARAAGGRVDVRVIFDQSTIEVFAADGETVISDSVFPTRPFARIEPLAPARLEGAMTMWPLRRVWAAAP